jgi:hypothetical protein
MLTKVHIARFQLIMAMIMHVVVFWPMLLLRNVDIHLQHCTVS